MIEHLEWDADDVESADGSFRPAQTYAEARSLLEQFAAEIRLVLLDLNIPFNEDDRAAEDKHGGTLLELIHEMNRRPNVRIRVIVVSGQEAAKGWSGENLQVRFKNTVIGIAENEDPLRDRLLDLKVEVVDYLDAVCSPKQGIKERLENACSLAVVLVRNEMDQFEDRTDASEIYSDDLRGLINQIEDRFKTQTITPRNGKAIERRFVDASALKSGDWGGFLWRGTLVQHLYTIANYRNDYVHIKKKPFRTDQGIKDAWVVPNEALDSLERGEYLGQAVELIVRDLLLWYLPWHEQVYMPWRESLSTGGTKP